MRNITFPIILSTLTTYVSGQLNFTTSNISSETHYSLNITSAVDIDNDGDIDLLGTQWNDLNAVFYYENNGNENFQLYNIPSAGSNHSYVGYAEPADLDNDGDLDIIISSYIYGSIVNFLQLSLMINDVNLNIIGKSIPVANEECEELGEDERCLWGNAGTNDH